MVRYRTVALRLVRLSYRLDHKELVTTVDLVQATEDDELIEFLLTDDVPKRASRMQQLDSAIEAVVVAYTARRMRSPVRLASVRGAYVPAFVASGAAAGVDVANAEAIAPEARFRLVPDVEENLLGLSPTAFEVLCGRILRAVGCVNVSVSRRSKDEGVDAIGELRLRDLADEHSGLYRFGGGISFLVYVQAKAYAMTHPVQQDEVHEVAGSWDAVRSQFFQSTLPEHLAVSLRKADYRFADPVLIAMMTTGRFTAGAISKANALGMILLDGEEIAQLLVEHHLGVRQDDSGGWELDLGFFDSQVVSPVASEAAQGAVEVLGPSPAATD